ncbi:hypothetical protein Pla52o_14290 [Novipirellula galeiformis]|uniref:Uncharacterized protein n=1 Tax=Novipirellula galeiformis TaxID=2528004 RepID=A0A5C6CP23_9BACT|nr:hypothetical protein Pla52o_14290 [Novipirellula galeiformis]
MTRLDCENTLTTEAPDHPETIDYQLASSLLGNEPIGNEAIAPDRSDHACPMCGQPKQTWSTLLQFKATAVYESGIENAQRCYEGDGFRR